MDGYYSIGEVSRITSISKDTLHFYDKIGLFKPRHVDTQNGYRYYSYQQFWILDIITCCRNLDIPLDTIKQLLATENNQSIVQFLKRHKETAEQKRDYYQRIMEDIDWYCKENDKITEYTDKNRIEIQYFSEEIVLYGENSEHEAAYHLKLQELYLRNHLRNESIRRNYGYVLNLVSAKKGRFHQLGEYIRLDGRLPSSLPENSVLRIPAGTYLCTEIKVVGNNADFGSLFAFAAQNGYQIQQLYADEIGLQLFDYQMYPCVIRAKILE